jgi:hypothetical protein
MTYLFKGPNFSNYRFHYSYLVTTSSQLSNPHTKIFDIKMGKLVYQKTNFKQTNFRQVTGSVYKASLHIHRSVLIYDY